jgi:hypothetical protein
MQNLESADKSIFLHLLKNQIFSKEVIKEMENQRSINEIEIGRCKFEVPLEDISPDCSREDWIRVGRAIYDALDGDDYGLAVFYQWSRRGRNHKRLQEIEAMWLSFTTYEKVPYPIGTLVKMGAEAVGVELESYEQILQQRMSKEFFMKKRNLSMYVPWHEEQSSELPVTKKIVPKKSPSLKKLKPCESDTSVEFDGCSVTIRLDCDAWGIDCNDCPVQPGWENLTMIRW